MIFAKKENGRVVFCPRNGYIDGVAISNIDVYFNKHPEVAKAEGWKQYIPYDGEWEGELETIETEETITEVARYD